MDVPMINSVGVGHLRGRIKSTQVMSLLVGNNYCLMSLLLVGSNYCSPHNFFIFVNVINLSSLLRKQKNVVQKQAGKQKSLSEACIQLFIYEFFFLFLNLFYLKKNVILRFLFFIYQSYAKLIQTRMKRRKKVIQILRLS